jgi:hypothetical protein
MNFGLQARLWDVAEVGLIRLSMYIAKKLFNEFCAKKEALKLFSKHCNRLMKQSIIV